MDEKSMCRDDSTGGRKAPVLKTATLALGWKAPLFRLLRWI
jgi:hypothetical protein